MQQIAKLQIGKQGVTDNFVQTLENHFKKHNTVRISVLKSARGEKGDVKNMAEDLVMQLGGDYTSRVIGFVIILKKGKKKVTKS